MKTRSRRRASHADPIKEATVDALNQIIEPLIELMLDAGVTVQEFNQLVRNRAVRVAMRRLKESNGKESRSRAAIMTGLPRSEIAKILRSSDTARTAKSDQLPARRVLAAWHDDPRFAEPSGNPAVLPIFGKAASFEQLVNRYGGGIPVRAMLDELTQMQSVEHLSDQRVKVRARVPMMTGLTPQSIAAVGQRSRDLLKTLAHNRREPLKPLLNLTAVSSTSDPAVLPAVKRLIANKGTAFMGFAKSLLTDPYPSSTADRKTEVQNSRFGVTLFCFEDDLENETKPMATESSRRKNLRRKIRAKASRSDKEN